MSFGRICIQLNPFLPLNHFISHKEIPSMYMDPNQKRAIPVKVRFEPVLDRILRKAATKTRMQHATYLYEIIEWAVANGVIEELMQDKQEDIAG